LTKRLCFGVTCLICYCITVIKRPSKHARITHAHRSTTSFQGTPIQAHLVKMEPEEQPGSVLVVGAEGVGKATLIRQLCGEASSSSVREAAANAGPAAGAESAAALLRLDTKYYTADALVYKTTPSAAGDSDEQPEHEAVVLAIDATGPAASLFAVQRWAAAHDTAAASVCLLVVNKCDVRDGGSSSSSSSSAAVSAAAEWCLENGFEYIECAAGAPAVDAGLSLEGERQGVRRVREALEAHLWPGLVLKERAAGGGAAGGGGLLGGGAGVAAAVDDTRDQAESEEPAAQELSEAAAVVAEAEPSVAEPAAAVPSSASAASASAAVPLSATAAGDDDADLQASVETFEQLMHQLQGACFLEGIVPCCAALSCAVLRSIPCWMCPCWMCLHPSHQPTPRQTPSTTSPGARERLAKLPDAERRTEAAALAMRFASMMGLGDSEDDDAEEEVGREDEAGGGGDQRRLFA